MLLSRLRWYWECDRLGPDIPLAHIFLYCHRWGKWICRRKFRYFGENAVFRPFAYAHYCSKISIGKNVIIHPGTFLSADPQEDGNIVIKDDVSIGSCVHIYTVNHCYDRTDIPIKYQGHCPAKEVKVCEGAWIGANVTILGGVTIGKNAVVGAGSVVTKNVEPFTVVCGNPARSIRTIKPNS